MIGYDYSINKGVVWRDNQGGLLPLSPPFLLPNLSKSQAKEIMKSSGALFLRWEAAFDARSTGAWWHVIKDSPDDLNQLAKKTRYIIRKAAKAYTSKIVDVGEILAHGYDVYSEAYSRYDTHEPMFGLDEFCRAVGDLPKQTEFWALYETENNKMVGFSENYIEAETCFYVSMWLTPDALKQSASYLLFYDMEKYYLNDMGFRYVSDGARSLSHDTNIHDFLISKFNFRRAYSELNVVYVPWLALLVYLFYPFRNTIGKIPLSAFKKASVLLKQEEASRGGGDIKK